MNCDLFAEVKLRHVSRAACPQHRHPSIKIPGKTIQHQADVLISFTFIVKSTVNIQLLTECSRFFRI